jgi:hypothetical protein
MQFVKEFQQAARETSEMIYTKWYEGITRGLSRRGVIGGITQPEGARLLNSLCSLVSVQVCIQLILCFIYYIFFYISAPY